MVEPVEDIVIEHVDEAIFLWLQRRDAVRAPNYSPAQFADLDERLGAHIDGLRVAADIGWKFADAALETSAPENFFPASVLAAEVIDARFAAIVERAEGAPDAFPGVLSALGWVEPRFLTGRVKTLLDSPSSFSQTLALAACDLHRKDPGAPLARFIMSPDPRLRARALRTAGDLGRVDALPAVQGCMTDDKREARYWACRSAMLLGDRRKALMELAAYAFAPGNHQSKALELLLQVNEIGEGHEFLQQLSNARDGERLRIMGCGFIGTVRYVPWLIEQMPNARFARIAADAFVSITGADFNLDQLEAMPPADFEDGPTEDPADENVEVPEDAALPWPDVARIESWWQKNKSRYNGSTRYFLGQPVTTQWCMEVLRTGFQHRRVTAAQYVSLHNPGTPLFNTSAPAWRQQRLLATMQ
jgi:uncharacterized protein (TIGR02270 family)